MLRLISRVVGSRTIAAATSNFQINIPRALGDVQTAGFSTLLQRFLPMQQSIFSSNIYQSVLLNSKISELQSSQNVPSRGLIKFSLTSGKRKTVKPVVKRFFRLHWGGWIRTIAGRHRHLWKKSPNNRMRARRHVFVNATQAHLLDSMVTNFWRKPKYYVDDPYEPYHTREEFFITRKKPHFRG